MPTASPFVADPQGTGMADDAGTDDEDEWRFSVDDVGEDADGESDGAVDENAGWTFDEDGEREEGDADDGVTIGEDDDGPTVRVGGEAATEGDAEAEGGNVAGSVAPDRPVESGTPDPEGVVFVAAGVLLTVLVFGGLAVPLTAVTVGYATLGVAVAAALLYVFFTRV